MLCISYHSAFASWLRDAFSRFPYFPRDQGVAKWAVISCNAEAMILSVRCLGTPDDMVEYSAKASPFSQQEIHGSFMCHLFSVIVLVPLLCMLFMCVCV